ncbi:ABC transporter ATP-binding protein [Priestia megaterium]|uniref:Heme ABC exporter, ATP-binding protein CcmA n=1 Tax=Priestia megaterium (strain ATCC 14581 / DSM 32 / CCUG 1817 / JCM 2506 / NBRC 15308 / NCIMB 9376 / NCTC 10342 / NRRL B-14308 / VKM B-512 / Ford 19) TaxID=1348623 RepID=A0A0B6AX61_PRIM2|nr:MULTISPECIES: ABC transporter ATP-binding protein [Priestia]AJI24449.1 heme ABC exporter, ATP-binding protein CcmA [Priestia megaterium NBRC 15308 = ATCC 14581]KFN00460.1 heme ABC exporter, ATP-binding protein CcmA [Priestia megaterium]KGJ73213.1 heme ABC transporter ATP-binding protein [Priestia megaterium NBRC 15308 = ATCC 14581]KLV33905.1 heme ABC transporter ATP-binding protein [Priestia megaterium]MCE4087684.1 ABC transporter ATP-binding protein [Priestia megaterium]
MEYVIEMLDIRKEFPGIVANDNITLQVKKGEIHALLGENGAGKSTLMNVLFGLYQPEKGQIRVNGQEVNITDPNVANDLGIGMVHQHFMLVQNFTVTENIILGNEPTRTGKINIKKAAQDIQELSNQYGLSVDPYAKIQDISVGMQQRVEILKTLYRGADILIFDEPTAALTPQEITELIQIMKKLIQEGKSIILITHKLKEIMSVCDRCTIIRKGVGVGTVNVQETNPDELAALMVGREVHFKTEKKTATPKEAVLTIKELVVEDSRGVEAVSSLDLSVRAGEIVGIAGVDGNGQTELIEAITGLRKIKSGSITLKNQELSTLSTRKITESGIGHIPQDRHKHGLVLDYTIGENIGLQTYYQKPMSKSGILNYKEMYKKAKELIAEYDVRTPSEFTQARSLSGGNQQKAIIAREVDRSPELLIAAQPTRGLDVGAIEFIHKKLIEERDKGRAVLLVSLELDEVINLSDRIAVIYEGKIVDIVDPKETNEQELGLLMAGGTREKAGGTA